MSINLSLLAEGLFVVHVFDVEACGLDVRRLVGDDDGVSAALCYLRLLLDAQARDVVCADRVGVAFEAVGVLNVVAYVREAARGVVVAEALCEVCRLARAAELVDVEHAALDVDSYVPALGVAERARAERTPEQSSRDGRALEAAAVCLREQDDERAVT